MSSQVSKTAPLDKVIAPNFYDIHNAIARKGAYAPDQRKPYMFFLLRGGRGSLKSSFCAMQVLLQLLRDKNSNGMVVRKTANSLRDSVFTDIKAAANRLNIETFVKSTTAPMEIKLPTKQKIMFSGLDEPEKLKGKTLEQGHFKVIWFEELSEFSSMAEIRSAMQTFVRGAEDYIILMSYNPPRDPNHWLNRELEVLAESEDTYLHKSTYLEAPQEWLGRPFIDMAEELKKNDEESYRHEYLGEVVGHSDKVVFAGHFSVEEFDTPPVKQTQQQRFFFGADWGYNDPTVMIRCFIKGGALYIDREFYQSDIHDHDTLAEEFNRILEGEAWPVNADSARPELVQAMRSRGLNFKSVKKLSGSRDRTFIDAGIRYMKALKMVYIHPRCKHTAEEFRNFCYKTDRHTGEILPVYEDKWNHCIDSIRYAINDNVRNKVSILDAI